ncbi:MAG: FGGY family carbohydrate kinase, partial [Nakamurella sp.]
MNPRYVAALDQGTTSTRCMLFDQHGRLVSIAQREHHQYFPRPGWVEHDAAEIWSVVKKVFPQALRDAGVQPAQIAALGVTNQRETTVVWNRRTGIPIGRAIVWQDTRTSQMLAQMSAEPDSADILGKTGLPMASYFSGSKLRWILDQDPSLRPAAERGDLLFGTMDSWIIWNLTGGADGDGLHVTDVTNASRTMLMNLE